MIPYSSGMSAWYSNTIMAISNLLRWQDDCPLFKYYYGNFKSTKVAGWVPVIQILLWQTSNLRSCENFTTPWREAFLISLLKNGWRHFWTPLSKIKLGCPWKAFKLKAAIFMHDLDVVYFNQHSAAHSTRKLLKILKTWNRLLASDSGLICRDPRSIFKFNFALFSQ